MTTGDSFSMARECSSCGGLSEMSERFCWRCGQKLPRRRQGPLLPVVVGALFMMVFVVAAALVRSDELPEVGGGIEPDTSTTVVPTTSTTPPEPEVRSLSIDSVSCTGDVPTHPCEYAVDGDRSTAWNAPGTGIGAEIVVHLAAAGRVTQLIITNHSEDEELLRSARIARLIIHFAGSDEEIDVVLEGWHGPYSVPVPLVETSSISLRIEEVHPAEADGGNAPSDGLALVEISVLGVPVEVSR